MICDSCGKEGARIKRLSRAYGKGKQTLVIENVPVVVCPNCGESYMTAETVREVERLRLQKRHVKAKRLVPMISYA